MLPVFTKACGIGGKETPAAHAGIDIAVFIFAHLLCGNIIGNHALCGAFSRKLCEVPVFRAFFYIVLIKHIYELGKGGCDIYAFLILDAVFLIDYTKSVRQVRSVFLARSSAFPFRSTLTKVGVEFIEDFHERI